MEDKTIPNYEWHCSKCDDIEELVVHSSERDSYMFPCEECGTDRTRLFGMPMQLKASYLDGQKREGFEELKIDSRLKAAAMKATGEGRTDDVREIDKEYAERKKKEKS